MFLVASNKQREVKFLLPSRNPPCVRKYFPELLAPRAEKIDHAVKTSADGRLTWLKSDNRGILDEFATFWVVVHG